MTDKEMTDLDVWIAINLFGFRWTDYPDDSTADNVAQVWRTERKDICVVSHTWQYGVETNDVKRFNHQWNNFQPTRVGKDAFEVLRKCNELVNERKLRNDICISNVYGSPFVSYPSDINPVGVVEETLELAICEFAKRMFEKV